MYDLGLGGFMSSLRLESIAFTIKCISLKVVRPQIVSIWWVNTPTLFTSYLTNNDDPFLHSDDLKSNIMFSLFSQAQMFF